MEKLTDFSKQLSKWFTLVVIIWAFLIISSLRLVPGLSLIHRICWELFFWDGADTSD